MARYMVKDLTFANQEADETGTVAPQLALLLDAFTDLTSRGFGDQDIWATRAYVESLGGETRKCENHAPLSTVGTSSNSRIAATWSTVTSCLVAILPANSLSVTVIRKPSPVLCSSCGGASTGWDGIS